MNQRRNFLKRTAILGLGSVMFQNELLANGLFGPRYPNEGLQLFTLFGVMDQDPKGYLEKISKVGYNCLLYTSDAADE